MPPTLLTGNAARLLLGVCCVIAAVTNGARSCAADTPLRVAVIDTGAKPAVPAELLDLFVVQLSQKEAFSLLERQEIHTLFQEQTQALSLAEGATQGSFISAGQILGADALVLVSAGPPNQQRLLPIEARVVETRRGVRFGGAVLSWSKDEQEVARQIQSAIEKIESRLQRIRRAEGDFTLVSLSGFRTDELSQEAHRFQRNLEIWLQSWLASQSGIAVAERSEVLPLIDERRLSEDLTRALGQADATIDGSFKLDFGKERPQVELTLRVRRKDRSATERTLRVPLGDDAELRHSASKAILELLSLDAEAATYDAQTEARRLTDEAQRLLTLWRDFEALERLIAAYALDPESDVTPPLLLRAGRMLGARVDRSGDSFDGAFYPTALLLCDVARRVLDREKLWPVSDARTVDQGELIGQIGDVCKLVYASQFAVRRHSESDLIQHEWLRAATEDLYRRYLAAAKSEGGQGYELAIYQGLQFGRYWAKTPEEALHQRYQLFASAAQLLSQERLGPYAYWSFVGDHRFRLSDNKDWANRSDLPQLSEAYFRKMRESDHAALRAVGEREAANYALWILKDKTQAMRHYRRFIRLIVERIVPNHSGLADEVHGLWLHLNHKTGSLALTDEEAGRLWSDVIRARWSTDRRCPNASQPWEYRITKTMLHLEKAGLIHEADQLLQGCLEALVASPVGMKPDQASRQWNETLGRLQLLKQGLAERHPELGRPSEQLSTLAVEPQSLLRADQLPDLLAAQEIPAYSWQFSGLVATASGYAVACRAQAKPAAGKTERFERREWNAIVRLDKQGETQAVSLFPESFLYDYRRSRIDNGMANLRPLAAAGDSLFLSIPSNGVVWFQPDAEPVHFSSKYLEQEDAHRRAVPFEEARQLLPIDGKIYLASGDVLHPVVFELDYQHSRVKTVLDSRALPRDSPLWGRVGFPISEGPPGELLVWALPNGVPREGAIPELSGGHLFLLNRSDHSIRQAKRSFRVRIPWVRSSPMHHLCVPTEEGGLAIFKPRELSMRWLLPGPSGAPPRQQSRDKLIQREFVYNDRYLIAGVKKGGGVSAREWRLYTRGVPQSLNTAASVWLLYENGDTNPRQLVAKNLPSPDEALHYLMDDQGRVTIMTKTEVLRIDIPMVSSPSHR